MNKFLVAGALICAPLTAAASCGSAFCTINTSWDAHGAWLEPGARLDLRYEYIRHDGCRLRRLLFAAVAASQPLVVRAGTGAASAERARRLSSRHAHEF